MLHSKLYGTLIDSTIPKNTIKTGGPKPPKDPNNFIIVLICILIFLIGLIVYNLYFIS